MKVLMSVDCLGGVWNFALELAAALPEVSYVLAVQGRAPSLAQREQAGRLGNVTLESRECLLEWMQGCERDLAMTGEWLLELGNRYSPDLVHLNDYAHATLPWTQPVLVVAHSCVVSWWRAVHGTSPPAEWDRYRARVGAAIERADTVVAPTQSFLREISAIYAAPRRGYTVYNARARRAARHLQSARDPCVLAAGRLWDEAKNLKALDEAAAGLDEKVFVAGELRSPEGQQAACEVAQPLGPLSASELAEWMERAMVFAAPALYEPFGLAPLEAALRGCALVLGDIATLRELWGGAAVFVDPRDAAALRAQLRLILADERRRTDLAARALRRAQLFSPARMATGYRGVYRELAPRADLPQQEALSA
jgi:glycogen(starch) synthase